VTEVITEITRELRIAMFSAGVGSIAELQVTPLMRMDNGQ